MPFQEREYRQARYGYFSFLGKLTRARLPTRWVDTQIVVSDSVLIQAPYTLENIKAPADKAQAENHVRKVVEHYYQRKKGASIPGAGSRAPVAMPIAAPRKGG